MDGYSAAILFDTVPNPSKNVTDISFFISYKGLVSISVFNITGELVGILTNAEFDTGKHNIKMNVSNLDNGSYLYKMTSGNSSITKQLVILR